MGVDLTVLISGGRNPHTPRTILGMLSSLSPSPRIRSDLKRWEFLWIRFLCSPCRSFPLLHLPWALVFWFCARCLSCLGYMVLGTSLCHPDSCVSDKQDLEWVFPLGLEGCFLSAHFHRDVVFSRTGVMAQDVYGNNMRL